MNKPKQSTPENGDQKNLDSLNKMMAGATDEVKRKVLEVLYDHDIDPDDPIFLIFGAMTEAKLAVAPIPEQMAKLQEGIKAVLNALCEQVDSSLKRHEELNYNFYVTAERLSTILNQKLFEIERQQQRRQGALSVSLRTALLWCLVTSSIGGIVGALLISMLMIVAAAQ